MTDDFATRSLLAAAGVAGSLLVAITVFLANRRQAKIDLTISLYREYYSSDFGRTRYAAERFVRAHGEKDWESWNPYEADDEPELREGYSEIIRFFHRLAVLEREGRLNRALAAQLFSREYGWWDAFLFSRMERRKNWWTKPAIVDLRQRLNIFGGYRLLNEGWRDGVTVFEDIPAKRARTDAEKRLRKLSARRDRYNAMLRR